VPGTARKGPWDGLRTMLSRDPAVFAMVILGLLRAGSARFQGGPGAAQVSVPHVVISAIASPGRRSWSKQDPVTRFLKADVGIRVMSEIAFYRCGTAQEDAPNVILLGRRTITSRSL
jgi:hypothetical protein